ncbi:MAG: C-di-GMP phosphodiesterase class [Chloroflexi bacterium]|nr:C-di-GMP phosphodiesterase class [Chloroflexota bacterium]
MTDSIPSRTRSAAGPTTTAHLVAALSMWGDLGIGLPLEHCLRACYIGLHIAADLKLDAAAREDVFWSLLLKDAGCTSFTTQAAAFVRGDEIAARRQMLFYADPDSIRDVMDWALTYLGPDTGPWTRAGRVVGFLTNGRDFFREGFASGIEVAQRIAARLNMPPSLGPTLAALFERWDGKGMPRGLRGDAIPIAARVAYASTYFEVFSRLGGAEAAGRVGLARSGSAFDGAVVEAFLRVSALPGFWSPLASESILETVLALKPGETAAPAGEPSFDVIALVFADFVDMKSHYLAGHSRRVARLASGIGRRLHLPAAELAILNRAALMHDVGFVAVPSFSVNKPPDERSSEENAAIVLHTQHAETVLAIIPALAGERSMVAAHHERRDAHGPRGLRWEDVPLGARIIAAADQFDDLTHDQPGVPGVEPDVAIQRLRAADGAGLDQDVLEKLVAEVRAPDLRAPSQGGWPAGLTEREVEVLRLLGKGVSRKEVAKTLVISDATVRHHLEHIYGKIGARTQVGAVLFALENGLLA